jgi:proline iminopeptidase
MKRIVLFVLLIAAAGIFKQLPETAGTAPAAIPKDTAYMVKTGGVKMITIDGKYKVWKKKAGEGK